jgi:hypothetical protein
MTDKTPATDREATRARLLAERILDRWHGDPDDDLAILSRAVVRLNEKASLDVGSWAATMMEALRDSDDGNNPFYSDDEDTISLARQLAEAVVAHLGAAR